MPTDNNQRRSIRERILHGRDQVGGTGARGDEDDAWFAGCPGIALGHVTGVLFVFGEDEVKMGGVVDGVEDGEDCSAGIANYCRLLLV